MQGSLDSGMCRQEGVCLGGVGWPLPAPRGLSQAAREPGFRAQCEWGWGDVSSVQRVAAGTPGVCRSRGALTWLPEVERVFTPQAPQLSLDCTPREPSAAFSQG